MYFSGEPYPVYLFQDHNFWHFLSFDRYRLSRCIYVVFFNICHLGKGTTYHFITSRFICLRGVSSQHSLRVLTYFQINARLKLATDRNKVRSKFKGVLKMKQKQCLAIFIRYYGLCRWEVRIEFPCLPYLEMWMSRF